MRPSGKISLHCLSPDQRDYPPFTGDRQNRSYDPHTSDSPELPVWYRSLPVRVKKVLPNHCVRELNLLLGVPYLHSYAMYLSTGLFSETV